MCVQKQSDKWGCLLTHLLHFTVAIVQTAPPRGQLVWIGRQREMTAGAVMSSTADSSFLILPFSLLVDVLTNLSCFCPEVIFTRRQFFSSVLTPPFLARTETVLTLYYLNPLCFLTARKQKCFQEKKGSPAVPKFAVRNYSFVVAAENQRCILTCLLICPINWILAGFLAAASGSCEDNADLGKWPFFFCCLLIEVAEFQKPQLMEYHKD